jgi:uncharacterized protein YkwD
MLKLINQEREKRKLKPLQNHPKLACAGKTQAKFMSENRKCTHYGENGSSAADRVKQCLHFSMFDELLACDQLTAEQAFYLWMKSPGQSRILLAPKLKYAGIGFYNDAWSVVFSEQ